MLAPDDREKQQTNFRLKIYTSLQLFIYASPISKTNREPIPTNTALLMLGIQNVVKSKILLTRRYATNRSYKIVLKWSMFYLSMIV